MTTIHWPAADWKRAKGLLERGFKPSIVAQMIGKTPEQLRGKMRWEDMSPAKREDRRAKINANRRSRANSPSESRYQPERITVEMAPAHVFEERARRQAIQRSPIEELLGVPPAGYSALDRKLAGLGV